MVCQCETCRAILERVERVQTTETTKHNRVRGFDIPVDERVYETQLAVKVELESAKWKQQQPTIAVLESLALGHRLRVKFFFGKNELDEFRFGMNEKVDGKDYIRFDIQSFPVATKRINRAMQELILVASLHPDLGCCLHQVSFLDVMSEDDMAIGLYFKRPVNESFNLGYTIEENLLHWSCNLLKSLKGRVSFIIRLEKGVKMILSTDKTLKEATVRESGLFPERTIYHQDGSFSNPNGDITRKVNQWLEDHFRLNGAKNQVLIELCSGAGNHTVGLCGMGFSKVISVEIDHNLVNRAKANIEANNLENVVLINDDMRNLSKILKRLQIETNHSSIVLVDPPRGGLPPSVAHFICTIPCEWLVYVACGDGLDKNASQLLDHFELSHLCLADHFPFTHFLEKVGIFRRRCQLKECLSSPAAQVS